MTVVQLITPLQKSATKQLINSRLPTRSLSQNRLIEGSLTCFVGKNTVVRLVNSLLKVRTLRIFTGLRATSRLRWIETQCFAKITLLLVS
jgi:hypothetical protein